MGDTKVTIKEVELLIDGVKFQVLAAILIVDGEVQTMNPEYPHTDWKRYYLTGNNHAALERNCLHRYSMLKKEAQRTEDNRVIDYSQLDWSVASGKAEVAAQREKRRKNAIRHKKTITKEWLNKLLKD